MRLTIFTVGLCFCYSFSAKDMPLHPLVLIFLGTMFLAMDYTDMLSVKPISTKSTSDESDEVKPIE